MKTILSLSFSGTLLLLFLLLFKQLYKNKFSKTWQYYIYFIVALRFLLPVTLDHTMTLTRYITEKISIFIIEKKDINKDTNNMITVDNKEEKDSIEIKKEEEKINKEIINKESINKETNETKKISETKETNKTTTEEQKQEQTQNNKLSEKSQKEYKNKIDMIKFLTSIPLAFYLFFLWLFGTVLLLLRKIILYQRFVYYIRAGKEEVAELEILNVLADCEEMLKISKPIELYCNPFIGSPIMIGFFRPKIIISPEYTKEELFYIFLHELIHYKRFDIFYKWLIQIIICIHWFNPFVYLLGKEVNKACELSCDEAVIAFLGDKGKKAYGDTLISALKKETIYKSYASMTFTEDVKEIKERLDAIMDFKKKTNIIKGITIIFTVAVCICFTVIGVYASESHNNSINNNNNINNNITNNININSSNNNSDNSNNNNILENKEKDIRKQSKKQNKSKKQNNSNNDTYYSYRQDGFFCNSYMIEIKWNVNAEDKENAALANITLEDKSKMTIYFSKKAKEYARDNKALAAIEETVNSIRKKESEQFPVIEVPYICRIEYIPLEQMLEFAEKYYKEEDIVGFYSIFPALDTKKQKEYYKKIYRQDREDFLICTIDSMDKDTILEYIKKSVRDDNIAYFSILIDKLPIKDRRKYAKRHIEHYYKTDDFAWFSVLFDYISFQEKKKWLNKAKNDEEEAFFTIISNEL